MGKATCSLNLYRTVIEGYKEPAMAARIIYGIAVHKFVDTMYKTGEVVQAVVAAKKAFSLPKIDDKKSLHLSDENHMITTCMNLWTGFIQDDSTFELIQVDGKPLTEQTFSFLFYEDDRIECWLEGTLDKIGQFKGGCFAIGDWKTTSSWDNRGYFYQYEMSRQLRFYRLALLLASRKYPDTTLGRIGKTRCGTFIDAIFIKPDRNAMEVKRSDVFQYDAFEMEAFEKSMYRFCERLSLRIKDLSYLDKEGLLNGACEGKWGKCSFWNVCKSPDNIAAILLDRDFVKRTWNPLDYNELDL